ncbi:nitroreductase family protein [Novipirellula artificiosorum]|uniref:Nitroreductase family protein n=1 Tax=Novipirellula artificiosorum TaxID=2528016 RepID=A0A5C6DTY2_9BACT|nr:hypothetical protein [Novipirellula artificiosorum]TWU39745.1 hypothetical protein Poly41_26010 [Novipirellula artificiosorum]
MIEPQVLNTILDAAVAAPSPDNNQPWLFQIDGDRISVFMDTRRSLPSDESSMFDLTAIGAAVENMVIAAAHHGYIATPVWQSFDGDHPSCDSAVVEIQMTPGATPDPLYPFISERCTCRKPYDSQPLASELCQQLEESVLQFSDVQVDWITSKQDKASFGKLVAKTDSLRFRHRPFHEELFRQLRFSTHEAETTNDGLDIRTLELPFGVATGLRCLRSWSIMQTLHTLRLTPLLTMPSSQAVRASGAIAFLSVPTKSSEAFFRGGRAIERFWLKGAEMGLSMHPLGSPPIFLLQEQPKPNFQTTIDSARHGLAKLLPNLGQRILQLAFRVGNSAPPSERSQRLPSDARQC